MLNGVLLGYQESTKCCERELIFCVQLKWIKSAVIFTIYFAHSSEFLLKELVIFGILGK